MSVSSESTRGRAGLSTSDGNAQLAQQVVPGHPHDPRPAGQGRGPALGGGPQQTGDPGTRRAATAESRGGSDRAGPHAAALGQAWCDVGTADLAAEGNALISHSETRRSFNVILPSTWSTAFWSMRHTERIEQSGMFVQNRSTPA
jgi:hypothetical protein